MEVTVANDFAGFLQRWIDSNQWPPQGKFTKFSKSILTLSAITNNGFHFHSGATVIEVEGYYDHSDSQRLRLVEVSVRLVVPSWGNLLLLSGQTILLDQPTKLPVEIGTIQGYVIIAREEDSPEEVLTVDYDITTPFGRLLDHFGCFPIETTELREQRQVESLEILNDSDSRVLLWQAIPVSPGELVSGNSASGKYWQLDDLGLKDQKNQQELLGLFLQDFADGEQQIILPTYDSALSKRDNGDFGALDDNGYTFDVSFFGIFGAQGTVNASELYIELSIFVAVPFAGRVKLTNIKGSLKTGLTAGINAVVASGDVKVTVKPEDNKHAVYIDLTVKVKLIGTKKIEDYKLFTLPF